MAARKARKPKHQKSEYPTLPERLEKVFIYRLAKKYGIVKEKCGKVKFYFENVKTGGENEANE